MDNPLFKLKEYANRKEVSSCSVGVDARATNRARNDKKVMRSALISFEKYFPKAFHKTPTLENFEANWQQFFDDLTKLFSRKQDLANAHNQIAKAIDEGTKNGLWQASIITQINTIRRDKPLRTKAWFNNAQTMQVFHSKWLGALALDKNVEKHSKNLLMNCIVSAFCHSGLNEINHINALINTLQQKKPINIKGNLVWIELELDPLAYKSKNKKFPFCTNYRRTANDTLVTRFFPTTITLIFISKYLHARNINQIIEIRDIWKAIISKIKDYTGQQLATTKICKSAVSIAEQLPKVSIPEALIEYTTKRNMSYSLGIENWLMIGGEQHQVNLDKSLCLHEHKPITSTSFATAHGNTFGLIGDLRKALKTRENGKLIHPKEISANVGDCLKSLNNNSLHEKILINWLLLFLNKRKTSTVENYFSAIGGLWLVMATDVNKNYSSDDFDAIYTSMLEHAQSEKSQDYKKRRLYQLHQYAVQNYDFPPLSSYTGGNNTVPHVKAAFIPESAFASMFQSISAAEDFTDTEKLITNMLLIVAYRTGLRLGEILKLKISDFEWSSQGWLFIRDNEYDKNKSNAARRKIPLIVLLTSAEIEIFKIYIKKFNIIERNAVSPNTLLFSTSSNYKSPLKKFEVSNLVSQILKASTGLDLFVFHSLRHSALSRLQLIIHYNNFGLSRQLAGLIKELIPYEESQIKEITQAICGLSSIGRYWAICTFAGHRTPEITFNRYFHFCDLLIYCALEQSQLTVTPNQLWNISTFSRKYIRELVGNDDSVTISAIRKELVNKLAKQGTSNVRCINNRLINPNRTIIDIPKDHSNKFQIVYEILHGIEQGKSIEMQMWLYNLTTEDVAKWKEKAELINQISTSKGKSRIKSTYKDTSLIVSLPKAQPDIDEVSTLVKKLRSKLKTFPKQEWRKHIYKLCKIILCRINTSNSEILIRHPSTLEFFLQFFDIYPKNRWYIEINASSKDDLKSWKHITRGYQRSINSNFQQDKRNPNGQAKVYLNSLIAPKSCENHNWKKYSSNVIKFVINILAIILLNKEQIKQLHEN